MNVRRWWQRGNEMAATKYTVPARHTSIIILEYEEGRKIFADDC